ncbi:MAG: DUF4179 domain-containing protein [Natronincolaceae bacterium]|nr:DUF4179 domain-containing protein [Bacillota bacterium]NLK91260.1 DUF4179 domain-containing protein [Clostridiales bacterium]
MKEIERILNKGKTDMDKMKVPEELGERLYKALDNKSPAKPKKTNRKAILAVACILVLIVGYNFSSLAYYGKRLLGYNQVMNGTLKQLNELGRGQLIGKDYTFENGITVILDGIMLDENQLLVFYTIKDPRGGVDEAPGINMSVKGFLREYIPQSGHGIINDEKTEIKWIHSFEKPSIFERTLKLKFSIAKNNMMETGQINFKIDANKAMGSILKQNINKTIKSGNTKIHLGYISASPTKTILYGSIQNIVELARDQISGERIRPNNVDIMLIANGKEVPYQGGGMSTDIKGIRFHSDFDALPEDLESVELFIKSFSVDRDVGKKIHIEKGISEQNVEILGQNIKIDNMYKSNENTYVTITTREDIILTRVGLMIDGERTDLKETTGGDLEKLDDGTIIYTRTLCFPGEGENYELGIERMTYTQPYDKTVKIPL